MGNRSVNKRLDDLERIPSTDTWELDLAWTDEELEEARANGDRILVWDDDDDIYFEDERPEADHGKDDQKQT